MLKSEFTNILFTNGSSSEFYFSFMMHYILSPSFSNLPLTDLMQVTQKPKFLYKMYPSSSLPFCAASLNHKVMIQFPLLFNSFHSLFTNVHSPKGYHEPSPPTSLIINKIYPHDSSHYLLILSLD